MHGHCIADLRKKIRHRTIKEYKKTLCIQETRGQIWGPVHSDHQFQKQASKSNLLQISELHNCLSHKVSTMTMQQWAMNVRCSLLNVFPRFLLALSLPDAIEQKRNWNVEQALTVDANKSFQLTSAKCNNWYVFERAQGIMELNSVKTNRWLPCTKR